MNGELNLASQLSARLCHDLISPLGAIGNGLELIEWSGTPETPEISLIRESFDSARARIAMFRVAFGTVTDKHEISASKLSGIVDDYTRTTRLTIDWPLDAPMSRMDAKLTLLLIMCLEYALPHGGEIGISLDGRHMMATAPDTTPASTAWDILKGTRAAGTADVQFAVARAMLSAAGGQIEIDENMPRIQLRITLP